MKIISYNVNGIRSAIRKGLVDWLKQYNPDIVALQELKAKQDQIDEKLFTQLGYKTYWYPAEKPGYSGVGLLTKIQPDQIHYGIGDDFFDREGRLIRADFGDITLINVYIPSGSSGDERQQIKMRFLEVFRNYLKQLRKQRPKLIVSGDFNICRLWIDIHNPEGHVNVSGFLPEEREWFAKLIEEDGFIDTFREFNQEPGQYSWWSFRQRSRERNKGWRIDYHLITPELRPQLKDAKILKEVAHSDHCPVMVEIDFNHNKNQNSNNTH